MLIGPVFTRELVITPRRTRTYIARAAYLLALLVLVCTAWLVLTGSQFIRDVGDMARFGSSLLTILAPLQLAVGVFFSALLAASTVAHEKDRRTLTLLLLTNLSNSELVLGTLMAALLNVLTLLAAALPLFMLAALFGGIGFGQVGRVFAVTLASVLVCGSLGSMLALWREKTFQALAMTVLAIVLWLGAWEVVAAGALGAQWLGFSTLTWATAFSPWQAILAATRPYLRADPALGVIGTPVWLFPLVAGVLTVAINALAVARVRVWNSSQDRTRLDDADEPAAGAESIWGDQAQSPGAAPAVARPAAKTKRSRAVWDQPILWREMRTWAYGRKMLVIRLVYCMLFALVAVGLHGIVHGHQSVAQAALATWLVPLYLLSFVLVNAQAVTALTSERDAKALDLLIVTEQTPKEIVFGKLLGVFYNTKEMVVLPILLTVYLWFAGAIGLENLLYVIGAAAILYGFVAVLGIHAGMTYPNSRSAVATSLGTVFFLFLGVATCMRMMIAFSGSFQAQLQPFLVFMLGGGLGLYLALGARNPSTAIAAASFLCPFATFYAIASFFLDSPLAVFLVMAVAYGFITAAMLVPAIYEFDVATGRTTIGEE